jgi:hypothetical protein
MLNDLNEHDTMAFLKGVPAIYPFDDLDIRGLICICFA